MHVRGYHFVNSALNSEAVQYAHAVCTKVIPVIKGSQIQVFDRDLLI